MLFSNDIFEFSRMILRRTTESRKRSLHMAERIRKVTRNLLSMIEVKYLHAAGSRKTSNPVGFPDE